MGKSLKELALKYNTDKLLHGYIPFYERTLPNDPKNILEIGVKEGNSIKMWREYFPMAEIHGLDLFQEYPIPDIPATWMWQGNQIDYRILEELRKHEFDVIIDDGSHNSRDQLMTFFGLYNGHHYYIEDLQCCDEDFYRQGLDLRVTAKYLWDVHKHSVFFDDNHKIVLI